MFHCLSAHCISSACRTAMVWQIRAWRWSGPNHRDVRRRNISYFNHGYLADTNRISRVNDWTSVSCSLVQEPISRYLFGVSDNILLVSVVLTSELLHETYSGHQTFTIWFLLHDIGSYRCQLCCVDSYWCHWRAYCQSSFQLETDKKSIAMY